MSRRLIMRAGSSLLALGVASAPAAVWGQAQASADTSAARYDVMRRETGAIAADPAVPGKAAAFAATRKTYDAEGQLVTLETGVLSAWQPESVEPKNWTGFQVHIRADTMYDVMGRKVREAMSGLSGGVLVTTAVTEYSYDQVGRALCTAVRMNPAAWATPLPDTEKKCRPGPEGANGPDRITRNHYNDLGDLVRVQRAVGVTGLEQDYVTYTYTPNGKQATVKDANGNLAQMTYDGLDRQKRWIFPNASIKGMANGTATAIEGDYEEYGYDPNGNRTRLRKRDRTELVYTYDALNRVSRKEVAGSPLATVDYAYDLAGNQTSAFFATAPLGGVVNEYDGFGLLKASTSTMGGVSRRSVNSYDAGGRRTELTFPDTVQFSYTYDRIGRPVSVYQGARGTTSPAMATFGHNDKGVLSSFTRSFGDVTRYCYDEALRQNAVLEAFAGFGDSTQYCYDAALRQYAVQSGSSGTTGHVRSDFVYSPISQLIEERRDNTAYSWTSGKALSRSYEVNGLNQYTRTLFGGAPSAEFEHDLNGNLKTTRAASDTGAVVTRNYRYDSENRLVSASGGRQG